MWKKWAEALNFALSFLTRLGVPRVAHDAVLARSVACYGLVGLVVGLVCTAPLYLISTAAGTSPWLLAWGYLLLDMWLTRGLHYDGLADLGDAWGSGATGDRFWQILRDSRLGAFGAMALFLGCSGLLLGAHTRLLAGQWLVLILAPVFGRALGVLLAHCAPPHDALSLGGKACAGATRTVALAHAALALACTVALTGAGALCALLGAAALLLGLRRLCATHGGCNGDILGASMVGAQILYMFV